MDILTAQETTACSPNARRCATKVMTQLDLHNKSVCQQETQPRRGTLQAKGIRSAVPVWKQDASVSRNLDAL